MTDNIGADWPLVLINPAHPKHAEAKALSEKVSNENIYLTKPEKSRLEKQAKQRKEDYLKVKPKKLRKLRKLKNNPRLFFRDMINKWKEI